MARISYKKPVVPEDTCPYIDMIQDLIEKIGTQEDPDFRKHQAELINALLEHVRESNRLLRASSYYWYTRSKKSDANAGR